MHKCKSKRKEEQKQESNDISHECFISSKVPKKNRTHGNYRIIMIETLKYSKEKKCNKFYI